MSFFFEVYLFGLLIYLSVLFVDLGFLNVCLRVYIVFINDVLKFCFFWREVFWRKLIILI